MISEGPPVDCWIDEMPPRPGDMERPPMTFKQVYNWLARAFDTANENNLAAFDSMKEVVLKLYTASPPPALPAPSDPTRKSYPTSELINKSRRTRRR